MYLSHPVRRMRDDPIAGETVTLVIEVSTDDSRDAVEQVVDDVGGSVERELQFADFAVRVPETAVERMCDLPGIERIETGETLSQAPFGVEE